MRALSVLLTLIFALSGCGRDNPLLFSVSQTTETRIGIVPDAIELRQNQKVSLQVVQFTSTGTVSLVGDPDLILSSSNTEVITVTSSTAVVVGIQAGTATVTARFKGATTVARVTVTDESILGIELNPAVIPITRNETQQVTVTAITSEGPVDVTSGTGIEYESSDENIFEVSDTGLVLGKDAGEAELEVSYGGFTVTATVFVREEMLQISNLRLEPETLSLRFGESQEVRAIGTLENGQDIDLISVGAIVEFQITDDTVANVSDEGIVTASSDTAGNATLIAQYGEFTAFAEINVTPPPASLIGISVRPNVVDMGVGAVSQLTVLGIYSDGSTADLTSSLTGTLYESKNVSVVEVSVDGLLRGVSAGNLVEVFVQHETFEAVVTVNVQAEVRLVSLAAAPSQINMNVGEFTSLVVIASYSDGSQVDVTNTAQYNFSPPGVANASSSGVIVGAAAGTTVLTISFDNQQTNVPINVESDEPEIIALSIQPSLITAGIGPNELSLPITVEATYSDGSQQNVTGASNLVLSITNPQIAQVVLGNFIEGVSVGTTELTATYDGLQASVPVEISQTTNQIVFIFVSGPPTLSVGQQEQISVLAVLADGSFQDITSSSRITIDPPSSGIVSIQNGTITGLAQGQVSVSAQYQSFVSADFVVRVTPAPDQLIGIEFEPTALNLLVGESEIVNVFALYQSGARVAVTFDPQIMSSWVGPIQVLPDVSGARVLATGPGNAQIDVNYLGFTAQLQIAIANTPPQVVALTINVEAMVEAGSSVPFSVEGQLSDGSFIDLTVDPMLSLTTTPNGIVEINNTLLRGLQPGMVTVTASYGSLSEQVMVTVIESPVTEIFWTPTSVTMDIGDTINLTLRARRANGQEFDLSTNRSVVLNASSFLNVNRSSTGIVLTAQTDGAGVVTAEYQTFTAQLRVTVNPPELIQIRAEPSPLQLSVGDTETIIVTGEYSDGSEQTLTGATFSVLNTAIATVDANGVVTAVSSGTTLLAVEFSGIRTTVSIEVSAPVLVSIEASPVQLTLQVGATAQISISGTFSDGSVQALSGGTFVSSNTNFATVDANGLVLAVGAGTTSIEAGFGGFTDQVRVTVNNAPVTLLGITLAPTMSSINIGDTQSYVVQASYSDGTQQTVTGASFSSDNNAIASVSSSGIATGISQGTTIIRASFQGETATASLEVLRPSVALVGIRVEPGAIILAPNGTQQVTVFGIYSDGTESAITGSNFSTSDASIATISSQGLVTAGANAGSAIITAQRSGFVANSVVIVTGSPVTLTGIRIEPDPISLTVGQSVRIQVIGSYSDGTEQTLSGATFISSNASVASVQSNGDVQGLDVGSSQIIATISGFTAVVDATVIAAGPVLFSIRIEPDNITLSQGGSTTITVIGTYSDGSEAPVTADTLESSDSSVVTVTPMGLIAGVSPGAATISATRGSLSAQASVTVQTVNAPTITGITPDAIPVSASTVNVSISGTDFLNQSQVLINGQVVPSIFQSNQLTAVIPVNFLQSSGVLEVVVRNPANQGGDSNTFEILVGEPPRVTSYAPSGALANSSVIVTVRGTDLLSLSASSAVLNIVNIVEDPSGIEAQITIVVPNIMPGNETVTISNPFGSTNIVIEVLENTGNPDLEVLNGQTVTLSGVNVFNNILVQTGGTIIGTGTEPLVLFSTGDITVRGHIEVDGQNGEDGFSDPANGGVGGPGGGGGGGAGDGDANPIAQGGVGSPNGGNAGNPIGAGTRAGNGGGDGGGVGGNGGCGQGGGGGALEGAGGSAGGDQGIGTGGAGGTPGSGSTFGGGTGGGGGSTCGPNSGGGGGGGGGVLILQVAQGGTLIVDGTLSANGGNAGNAFFGTGGGGGGSGGRIEIIAPSGNIVINDTISVRGGNGGQADFGDGGAGGGGGRVLVNALPLGNITANLGLFDLVGGQPGPSLGNGFPGESGQDGSVTITP
ncbi:MAG: Ig-like domain-containing protein [Myxococcota bacterium]|nr:Ig-like domain-containing protein [Myxococcota bacterium]